MSGVVGALQLVLLAMAAFALLGALASALVYPLARATLLRWHPAARAQLLTLWSAAPVAVALGLIAACLLPSGLAVLGIVGDHCLAHGNHHGHLCFAHLPAGSGTATGWMLLALAAAVAGSALARTLGAWLRTRVVLRSLAAVSERAPDGTLLVASPLFLSLTAGALRPEIYLTRGLFAALPAPLLTAVLAHERAHVARRDPLRKLVAALCGAAHLPWTRRLLASDLALACEQACDEEAALSCRDRLEVAEAILAAERLLGGAAGDLEPAASAFAGSHLTSRVEALLAPARSPRRLRLGRLALAAAACVLAGADALHHATETILGILG